MRVMQVLAGAKQGGAETYFVDLVTALHRAGIEQKVVIRRDSARCDQLRAAGLDPVELSFGNFLDFNTRRRLRYETNAFRPHVMQTWMKRATAACPRGDFIHVGWFGGYYSMKYYKHCDHLVAVTRDIVRHITEGGWPAARAHYLPTFASDIPAAPIPRREFDTPEEAPLILALGRLDPVKGFDVLLRALVDVPKAYLWLAGEGRLKEKLKAETETLGLSSRVRFLGWRNDRGALFTTCDLCVMPSRHEPFGTVMIEAWAYAKPLIVAAAQGPRGLIRDGENGVMVPIDDAPALGRAINRLLNSPHLMNQIATTGRRDYEADFTEARVVERYLAFYDRIVQESMSA